MESRANTGDLAFIAGPGARRKYVSYLSTDEVAACEQRAKERLRRPLSTHQRELWTDIHNDLLNELEVRQLQLPGLQGPSSTRR